MIPKLFLAIILFSLGCLGGPIFDDPQSMIVDQVLVCPGCHGVQASTPLICDDPFKIKVPMIWFVKKEDDSHIYMYMGYYQSYEKPNQKGAGILFRDKSKWKNKRAKVYELTNGEVYFYYTCIKLKKRDIRKIIKVPIIDILIGDNEDAFFSGERVSSYLKVF